MKTLTVLLAASLLTASLAMAGSPGEELFQKNCAACHPEGGNIINAKKTLHKASLEANGIKTADDIVAKMRHPGPGMTTFGEQALSAADARAIAGYIQASFK